MNLIALASKISDIMRREYGVKIAFDFSGNGLELGNRAALQ
jgi:hypothetical protein